MTMYRRNIGKTGEQIARRYFISRGCVILDQNIYYREGEIDLIIRDGEEIVFVEVKTRTSLEHGWGREAMTSLKREHMRSAIDKYLSDHHELNSVEIRADLVEVFLHLQSKKARLRHLKRIII